MRWFLIALCSPLFAAPRTVHPAPTSSDIVALAERCPGGGSAAYLELVRAVQGDPDAAWPACAQMARGAARDALERALGVPELRSAHLVVAGRIAKVETIQGGVVDYHTLLAHLEDTEVVSGFHEATAEAERNGTVAVLRGTSRDWWLADTLKRDLERITDQRTFVFRRCDLFHRQRPGDTSALALTLLEYTTLPRVAATVLR